MSKDNGIIRIGRKGKRKVQFGDESAPIIEVDVIALYNGWTEIDRQHRDDKGQVDPAALAALNNAAWNYVRGIVMQSCPPDRRHDAEEVAASISLAEALEFLARMSEEANALSDFFKVRSRDVPSSPERTELTFST